MALCHVYAAKAAQTPHLKWHIANTKKCIYTRLFIATQRQHKCIYMEITIE